MHDVVIARSGSLGVGPLWPTLAQAEESSVVTWFAMFFTSGDALGMIIIWSLLVLSALSLGYTLKLAVQYRRAAIEPDDLRDRLADLLTERRYREAIELAQDDPSYLGRLTGAALQEAANGYGAMERALEETADTETARMLRPIEYLNVVGNISPMIGLFGTVYGMIRAFNELVASGGRPDAAELASGISTALVTTFWGLVVAIPALTAYALIRNKIDALTSEALVSVEELIHLFKPDATRGPAPPGQRPRATPDPQA